MTKQWYWKFNSERYAVHIESKRLLNMIEKRFDTKHSATYMKKDKTIAWDILVLENDLNTVKRFINSNKKKTNDQKNN